MKVVEGGGESLAERIDAYLDGLLSPAEARATERMLAEPDVGAALAEALALREILGDTSDAPTPPGLADRIIGALDMAEDTSDVNVAEASGQRRSVGQAALFGASWMVRGPLAMIPSTPDNDDVRPPKRSWWRPILGLGRRK